MRQEAPPIGTAQCDPFRIFFQDPFLFFAEKKGDLEIPGSNFRDNDKFPRALGGLECCTSSSQHLEHIYPSNTSWQLELKIASLDKLESGGEKKKIPAGMFIFGKSQRRKRKGRGSMRYLEHVRK